MVNGRSKDMKKPPFEEAANKALFCRIIRGMTVRRGINLIIMGNIFTGNLGRGSNFSGSLDGKSLGFYGQAFA